MSRLVLHHELDHLAELLTPRDDVVGERLVAEGVFETGDGPFRHYRRTVTVDRDTDPASVTEEIEFELAIPVWGRLFVPLFKHTLRERRTTTPWWAPPDSWDQRTANVVALLAVMTLIAGYLGTLITQTITFAADEFDASDSDQGVTLAAVRIGVVLALVVVAAADRRGRRVMLVGASIAACLLAATGAVAPGMVWLGGSQTLARGMSTAMALLIGIIAAEEVPRNSRAYTASLLAMTAALGSGMAVWALPLADLGEQAWRLLYVLPLLGVPITLAVARGLPESRRFEAARERRVHPQPSRVWLLAVSGFLLALFVAPASQFQNEFLRDERGYSAAGIAVFTLSTNTPGGIGVLLGGRLADTRGRRRVGAIAVLGGTAATVAMYLATGWPLWGFSVLGAIVGSAAIPALGVYGPELFPTTTRGRTNGLISLVGVAGSGLGLLAVGLLSDEFGEFGPALALMAIGPALVALLIVLAYPETAHKELEELNPEDAPVR